MKVIKGRFRSKGRRVWPQKKEKEEQVKYLKAVVEEINTLLFGQSRCRV